MSIRETRERPRQAYAVPRSTAPVDLRLDANEGPALALALDERATAPATLCRYPSTAELERDLAERFGIDPERVLVTAGADDALLRCALAFLGKDRDLVLPTPAFEMIPRYAQLSGARVLEVPEEDGRYPVAAVLDAQRAAGDRLGLTALVSPNNPTGSVASLEDLRRIALARPDARVLADFAYADFAERDLSADALEIDNVICVRTFSKAWGLAGARVGWAMGSREDIAALRAAGNPYAVSASSIAAARARLANDEPAVRAHVATVAEERVRLATALFAVGARPYVSQANFVLAECDDPSWVRDGLASLGIGVRTFPDREELASCVRITCPGDSRAMERLERALLCVRAPQLTILDGDVLENVPFQDLLALRASRRIATLETGDSEAPAERPLEDVPGRFGCQRAWLVTARPERVLQAKAAGIVAIGWAKEPESREELLRSGAARVIERLEEIPDA